MSVTWKDESTRTLGTVGPAEVRAVPTTWVGYSDGLRFAVTRHRDYPGQWVLRCHAIGVDIQALDTITAQDAMEEAVRFIVRRLEKMLKGLR